MTLPSYSLTYSAEAQRTVLLLHGFMGCRFDWNEVVEQIDLKYRCLRVDLPGHHWSCSDLSPESYSMPGCAQLVIDLLDHNRIDQCHLVGYSMGGRLGLYLLTHFPKRFSAAMIESASPGLRTDPEREARLTDDRKLARRLREEPFEKFVRAWYRLPRFNTIDQTTSRFEALIKRRLQADPLGLALSLEQMGTGLMPSLWSELPHLKTPTLFVAGERDEKYRTLAHEMATLCPRGQVAIIPGAGHNTHFERPYEFSRMLTGFFDADR